MSNEEIVVVETQKAKSLKEEAKDEFEFYLCGCLQNAKPSLEKIASSAIRRGIDGLTEYLHNYFAA